jgi:hypothetical protein
MRSVTMAVDLAEKVANKELMDLQLFKELGKHSVTLPQARVFWEAITHL